MTKQERKAIRKRVARGASFFDEKCPRWARRIDKTSLDIWDPRRCVLGQIQGDYVEGLEYFALTDGTAWTMGLCMSNRNTHPYWGYNSRGAEELKHLRWEWKKQIDRRLALRA